MGSTRRGTRADVLWRQLLPGWGEPGVSTAVQCALHPKTWPGKAPHCNPQALRSGRPAASGQAGPDELLERPAKVGAEEQEHSHCPHWLLLPG